MFVQSVFFRDALEEEEPGKISSDIAKFHGAGFFFFIYLIIYLILPFPNAYASVSVDSSVSF